MGFDLLNISQIDYKFGDIQIHQPTIYELGQILKEEQNLFFCLKIFSDSLKDMFDIFGVPNGIELHEYDYLYLLLSDNPLTKERYAEQRVYLIQFLGLLFPNAEINIYQDNIMIKQNDIISLIDKDNLLEFKNIIKKMFKLDFLFSGGGQTQDYNPANEAAKKIAEKFKQSRAKIAAEKGEENKVGIIENYVSILSVGLKTTPKYICETMTLYNLLTIFERFKLKMEWDLDIKVKLAGGGSENHESPKVWFSII